MFSTLRRLKQKRKQETKGSKTHLNPSSPANESSSNPSPCAGSPFPSRPTTPGPSTPLAATPQTITSTTLVHLTTLACTTGTTPDTTSKLNGPGRMATGLESTLQALHIGADIIPPLKPVFGSILSFLDVLQAVTTNTEEYDELTLELKTMADTLKEYLSEPQLEDITNNSTYTRISLSIEAEVAQVKNQQNHGKVKKAFDSSKDRDNIIECYRRIEALFRQLLTDVSLRTLRSVNKQRVTTLLQGMSPVDEARYNSSYSMTIKRRGCTKQTREQIQATLQDWVRNPDGAKVYWMNGMAGTGKTTIAYSLCEWLEANGKLGASFFCSRASHSCQRVDSVIPTIVYGLARCSAAFRAALVKALEDDPGISKLNITKQFEKLVQEPIQAIDPLVLEGVVIVIDALDECENDNGVQLILRTILRPSASLPLKFFVASRPEPAIYKEMSSLVGYLSTVLHLHDIEQSIVEGDIEKYLTEALNLMSPPPSGSQIHQLAKRSGKLFIYAATVVRYVLPGKVAADSMGRLTAILRAKSQQTNKGTPNKKYKQLDELYSIVLATAFDEELEQEETEAMRLVLWTVICAEEPMSIPTIALFLSLAEEQVVSVLQALRSVLHISESTEIVSTLHASFPDYMLDDSRSEKFCCNRGRHNRILAGGCFRIMEEQLHFNICHLNSSSTRDKDVGDLDQRIKRYISPALSYACRYWSDHLREAGSPDAHHSEVADFLKLRLLFWMEVVNLTNQLYQGINSLRWLVRAQIATKMAADAYMFAEAFRQSNCESSTPHIYISALPFLAKSNSSVYTNYWGRLHGLIDVLGIATKHERKAVGVEWETESAVISIGFSPDGTRIAHGDSHGTISVRDARTGDILIGPIRDIDDGDYDSIRPISFSPDGARVTYVIRCAGVVRAVRVRDTHTGEIVAELLNENRDWGHKAAISPSGEHIAIDCTNFAIELWDVYTGAAVAKPFEGHKDAILDIGFSPDNTRIVSLSRDNAILVWYVSTGEIVAGPVRERSDIDWAAFSPNGAHIALRFYMGTIKLWDIATGSITETRFEARFDPGEAAPKWSPNGTSLVVKCAESLTAVDIRTGDIIARTPCDDYTLAIAISPDGTRVVHESRVGMKMMDSGWDLGVKNPRQKNLQGWFIAGNELLFFAPKQYDFHTQDPHSTLLLSSDKTISPVLVDYRNLSMGERWAECFVS